MKLTKLALLAVVAASTVAYSAKAAVVGTTTNYSKLNISGVITTNAGYTLGNGVYKYKTGTVKFSNKDLIARFAEWSTNDLTAWKTAGAQLEFDWNSYQPIVADKTGTNILFYCDTGVSFAFMYIDWFYYYGPSLEVYVNKDPGSDVYNYPNNIAYFEFNYNKSGDAAHYVSFGSNGTGTGSEKYTQLWDKNGNYTTWTDSETASTVDSGYYNDESESSLSVKFSATGHGAGYNPYIY